MVGVHLEHVLHIDLFVLLLMVDGRRLRCRFRSLPGIAVRCLGVVVFGAGIFQLSVLVFPVLDRIFL